MTVWSNGWRGLAERATATPASGVIGSDLGRILTIDLRSEACGTTSGGRPVGPPTGWPWAPAVLTSRSRILPGFLIVGAQRCGTSSMYRALVQHPNVLPAGLNKGVHYFDVDFDRGTDWYRSHFPLRRTAAQVERRTGAPAVTFESSPYYMFHPLAGERIAAVLPGIKVICLLRDPVERAYSAHAHELARGFEDLAFEDGVEQEPRRLEGEIARMKQGAGYESHHLQHNAYVLRGEYVDQLERLALTLGRDNLHVVDSQDFFTDPLVAFQGVTDFLGLPRWDARGLRAAQRPAASGGHGR